MYKPVMRSAATIAVLVAASLIVTPAVAQAAAPESAPVTISPAPGTPDASPQTQISILGLARGRIRAVTVMGSRSGRHAGTLRGYRGVPGASLILRRPLDQGERVKVRVVLAGRHPVSSAFTVAHLAPPPPVIDLEVTQPSKLSHFVSQPALLSPRITVRKGSSRLRGDVFLTPLPSPIIHPESNNTLAIHPVGPGGPMIVDNHGRLVWFDQLPAPLVAADFRPQRYLGREVLTWWQGDVTASAYGLGDGVIADTSYQTLRTVKAGNGYQADLHEFRLTPSGEALFTVDAPVLAHLPGTRRGTLARLLDSIVQEVDVRTGLVVWEWHGLGHIPLADSYATPANSADYDAYHFNSIEPVAGGRLLVSARDTSAVYLLDQWTDRIVWTLGGKASSFRLGRGARFFFQHDAWLTGDHRLSLFDDEAGPPIEAPDSRGIRLWLDPSRRTATLVGQFRRPGRGTLAESEGSVQNLALGRTFVGFGSSPFFSEFSAGGRLLFDASLPADDGSYRTFVFPWTATPRTRPSLAGQRSSPSSVTLFASWNGATDVSRWQVLAAAAGGSDQVLATTPARGFETRIALASSASTFAVRAVSANGRVLATSAAVPAS
jgi:hypothetical protein